MTSPKRPAQRLGELAFVPFVALLMLDLRLPLATPALVATLVLGGMIAASARARGTATHVPLRYLFLAAWVLWVLIMGVTTGAGVASLRWAVSVLVGLSPIVIYDLAIARRRAPTRPSYLLYLILGLGFMLALFTIYMTMENPMAVRLMVAYNPTDPALQRLGVTLPIFAGGGYRLIYGLAILPPVAVYVTQARHSTSGQRIIAIVAIVVGGTLLILADIATAIIVAAAALLVSFVFRASRAVQILALVGLPILLTLLTTTSMAASLARSLSTLFPTQTAVHLRLVELSIALSGVATEGSLGARFDFAEKSMATFLDNPWLGTLHLSGFDILRDSEFVGQHSEWLDALARYGAVGSLFLLGFIVWSIIDVIRRYQGRREVLAASISGVALLVVGFLNPVFASGVFLSFFLVVPLTIIGSQSEAGREGSESDTRVSTPRGARRITPSAPASGV